MVSYWSPPTVRYVQELCPESPSSGEAPPLSPALASVGVRIPPPCDYSLMQLRLDGDLSTGGLA